MTFFFIQLHHERTEERRKLVKGKNDSKDNIQDKWKKVLALAQDKSTEQPEENDPEAGKTKPKVTKLKKLLTRPISELSFQSVNEISSMEAEADEQGSLCNTFSLTKETPPPKIWISKSASMEDDLEE